MSVFCPSDVWLCCHHWWSDCLRSELCDARYLHIISSLSSHLKLVRSVSLYLVCKRPSEACCGLHAWGMVTIHWSWSSHIISCQMIQESCVMYKIVWLPPNVSLSSSDFSVPNFRLVCTRRGMSVWNISVWSMSYVRCSDLSSIKPPTVSSYEGKQVWLYHVKCS